MSDVNDCRPAFVLCTARSGSTLLRQVLDAHPDIACPPELNLAVAFDAISFASCHAVAHEDDAALSVTRPICRQLAEDTAGAYARRAGKQRWCEKSLPSLNNVDLLLKIYPDAYFICLYRECTDTIMSAMEASPWGYGGYGFEPYVRSDPQNIALALARYWTDHIEVLTAFEQQHSGLCHRVRYEDIVLQPVETVSALFAFLDLSWDARYLESGRIFDNTALCDPGDYKIRYTRNFDTGSLGRGWAVPVDLIPDALRQRINRLHDELGYPGLDAAFSESLAFRRNETQQSSATTTAWPSGDGAVRSLDDLFKRRVASRLASQHWSWSPRVSSSIRIIAIDQAKQWTLDLDAGLVHEGARPAGCTVLTDSETLYGIANGTRNPGTELRRARIRIECETAQPTEIYWRHLDVVAALLAPAHLNKQQEINRTLA